MESFQNAGLMIGVQAVSRLGSFALNQAVAGHVSPAAYGYANITLQLVLTTILFLPREPFRRAIVRLASTPSTPTSTPAPHPHGLAPWVALPAALIACLAYALTSRAGDGASLSQAHGALLATLVGAALELAAEPLYVVLLTRAAYGVRARVEGLGVALRCGVIAACVLGMGWGPLAFGVGHVAYGAWLFLAYAAQIGWDAAVWVPRTNVLVAYKDTLAPLVLQTGLKYVLTHGESLILVAASSFYDQGLFALVNNLGSLVVRIVFQPLEEIAFNTFSQSRSTPTDAPTDGEADDGGEGDNEVEGGGYTLLCVLTKSVLLVGAAFAAFGPPFSRLLLDVLHGSLWVSTGAPGVLAWYTLYVGFLALNGITEAYVHAMASPDQLHTLNGMLLVFTLGFAVAGLAGTSVAGTIGLIVANMFNMTQRICYSLHCIYVSFPTAGSAPLPPGASWRDLLPAPAVLASFAFASLLSSGVGATFVALTDQGRYPSHAVRALHAISALPGLAAVFVSLYVFERPLLVSVVGVLRSRRHSSRRHSSSSASTSSKKEE